MARSISFDINARDRASAELIRVGQNVEQVERHIESLNRRSVEIDVDTASTERQLQVLREELRGATGDRRIEVEADISRAERQLERLRNNRIQIDVDSAAAEAQLEALHHAVGRLDGRKVNVQIDVDSTAALGKIAMVGMALGGLMPLVSSLGLGLVGIGAAGAVGFGVIAASLSGVGGAVTALGAKDTSVSSSMKSNANAVKSAVEGVTHAQRALKDAIQGVSDALHNQSNALQGIADAQQGVRDAIQAVSDAQHAQASAAIAVQDAQHGVTAAIEHVQDAETSLADAQRAATQAQESLNDARKAAADRLKDLQRSEEDMRLSQASATLSVFEAEQRLQELLVDPKATDLQRARARLTVSEALQRQKEVGDDAKKLATTKAEADSKGVEGSDEVKAALERQQQAQQRVVAETRAVRDAHEAVAKAQRAVTDAEYAYAQSVRHVAEATQEVAARQRAVTEAQYGYEQATRKVADAHLAVKDAQQGIVDAQARVREASQQAGAAGSTAMNNLKNAMAGLTPEGRRFAIFLRGLLDGPIKDLRDAGQRNLLPGLQAGIQSMLPYAGTITKSFGAIAKNLGDMFAKLGPHIGPAVAQLARLAAVASNRIFKDIGDFIGFLLDKFTKWAEGQSTATITKSLESFERVMKKVWEGLKLIAEGLKWLFEHQKDMLMISSAIMGIRLAMLAINAVAALGPWGLLAVGILVLGAGLVYLYNHSETFRNAVNALWEKLKEGFKVIADILMPHLKDLWKTIKEDLWPAFQGLVVALGPVIDFMVKTLWPIFARIWGIIIDVVRGAIKIVAGIINIATGLISGDWGKVWTGIKQVFSGIWIAIQGVLKGAWDILKGIFVGVYQWVKDKTVEAWDAVKKKISDVWEGIKGLLKTGWDWIKNTVFDKLSAGVKGLGTAFETAKDLIGKAWDKVKEVAAVPIRFVINTVIGGVAKKFNDIAGSVGIGLRLPVPVAGFATGGPINGLGHGTSDSVPIMASSGEWIIRANAAKKLGHQAMDIINNADKLDVSGDISGAVIKRRGFASGGEISPEIAARVAGVRSWIPSVDPLPYTMGGVGPGTYDCSGLVGEVWARLTGRPSYRRNFDTSALASNPGRFGFAGGPGMFTVGVNDSRVPGAQKGSSQHTAGNLAGMGFEAASTASGIKVGSAAQSPMNFAKVLHLESLGTAGAGDMGGGGGFSWNPLDWAKSLAKSAIGAIADGWWGSLGGMGAVGQLGIGLGKKLISSIFDSGGMLQPGLNLAYNGTGSPEPVLTGNQWENVNRVAQVNGTTQRGGDTHFHIPISNAVIGNERQVAKVVTEALSSAVKSGTLRLPAAR